MFGFCSVGGFEFDLEGGIIAGLGGVDGDGVAVGDGDFEVFEFSEDAGLSGVAEGVVFSGFNGEVPCFVFLGADVKICGAVVLDAEVLEVDGEGELFDGVGVFGKDAVVGFAFVDSHYTVCNV